MKVAVIGLWHLGSVTAACLADGGHHVTAYDGEASVIARFARGEAPVHEPHLNEWLRRGIDRGMIRAATDSHQAIEGADIVWITWDTPILADNSADIDRVIGDIQQVLAVAAAGQLVLISSQLPVGTTARLEQWLADAGCPPVTFGYVPENLRLGTAIESFTKPARVVAGLRRAQDRERVQELLAPFTDRIEWMSVESAEMTKHALNAFLAASVAFANEIARLCEVAGADAAEVARGLKTDPRIGSRAYVSPGGAFAGGTLARDLEFLAQLGTARGETLDVIPAIAASNERHRRWAVHRLDRHFGSFAGRTIAIWGLTYKPDTDTLRGSPAVALVEWLVGRGASVRAYDPVVKELPRELRSACTLCGSALDAADGAEALVISTGYPEFREIRPADLVAVMKQARVLDENRFLTTTMGQHEGLEYITVGVPSSRTAGTASGPVRPA